MFLAWPHPCQNPRVPHTLATAVHSDLLIKKSRFIGCVQAVPDRAAAQAVVTALRAAHPGAAHVLHIPDCAVTFHVELLAAALKARV